MNTGDVIFKGYFDLNDALGDFNKFANAIESRLKQLTRAVSQTGSQKTEDRVLELMGINERAFRNAEAKVNAFRQRVSQAVKAGLIEPQRAESVLQSVENRLESIRNRVERLNYKIQENIAFTKADILALRGVNAELNTFERRTAKAERTLATTNLRIQENAKRFNEFFRATVIGGFALQQLGTFLTYNLSVPLARAAKEIAQITLRFDTLETLLKERGNRSLQEVAGSIDLVGRVAKLRNFDLELSTTLYSRLFEATRGAIDDQIFEKLSKGLSQVLTTIESGEKRAFFGQIQDILGGGDVANLEKTLSLAPALKTVYDEIDKATKGTLSQQELLIKALERLAELPALNDLQTKVKNLRVQFELWGARIGRIYKDDLEKLVNFIEKRVFPALESLLQWFERLDPFWQNMSLGILALTAAIGPLIYVLGTLGVVMGGVAYVARATALGIGALTGSTAAAKFAAADLTTLLAGATASGGVFGKVAAFLPRLVSLLNPVTLAITAVAVVLGGLLVNNAGGSMDALQGLANVAGGTLTKAMFALGEAVRFVSLGFEAWGKAIDWIANTKIGAVLGFVLSLLIQILTIVAMTLPTALTALGSIIEFITNLITEGWNKAWNVLLLRLMEFQEELYNALPLMAKFEMWLERIFGEESPRKKALIEQRKLVGELTGEQQKNLLVGQKVTIAQNELTTSVLKSAAAIKTLTDALVKQNKELRDARFNAEQAAYDRTTDVAQRGYSAAVGGLDEAIGDADLTDASQAAAARDRVFKANALEMQGARQAMARRTYLEFQQELRKQQEDLLDMFQKEDNAALKQFYARSAELYNKFAQSPEKIFPSIADILKETYLKDPVVGQNLRALQAYFSTQQQQLALFRQAQKANEKEILDAQENSRKRIDEFNKRVGEAQGQQREASAEQLALSQTEEAEQAISILSRARERLLRDKDKVLAIDALVAELARIQEKITEQFNIIRDAELQAVESSSGTELDKAKQRADILRKYRAAVLDLNSETNDFTQDKIQEALDKQKENREKLTQLILSYRDTAESNIDLLLEVGELTGKVDVDAIKRNSDSLKNTVEYVVSANVYDIADTFSKTRELIKSISGKYPEEVKKFLSSVNDAFVTTKDYSNKQVIQDLIDQSEGVLRFLETVLATHAFANDIEKADFNNFLEGYIKFIEGLKGQRDILNSAAGAELKTFEAEEVRLNQQLRMNDLASEELRITEQILKIRKDRGYAIDLPGLKGFASELLDMLSGGSRALYDIQKKILEREKEANQLELEIAIARLQIEQRILEMKIMASDLSAEDKQKAIDESRKTTETLIEGLRKQGELQKVLLDEQIESLERFGGSIGNIIIGSITSAIGSLFDKKKESDKGEGDLEASVYSKEEDTPGFDPEAVDEQADSLGKLEGKYKAVSKAVGVAAKAIMSMNDLSIKSIRNAVAEALNAIAQEAAVKALQYAAIALSAAVFGDWGTAGKAAVAAAAWGGVAIAAKLGADLIGTADSTSSSNSTTQSARQGGVLEEQTERDILKQKALSVMIELDIRTDDGIIIKKNIKALSQNTELSTLTLNSQEGWAYAPSV